MVLFSININLSNIRFIFFILFICILSSLVIFIFFSYYFFHWLSLNYNNEYFSLKDYTKRGKKILEKYGDIKIEKIYLFREPVWKVTEYCLNLLTMFSYDKTLKCFRKKCKNDSFTPQHTGIIFIVKDNNNSKKMIKVEKINYLGIFNNFTIHEKMELKRIVPKNNITLNKILNKTKERMGENKFFNWSLFNNNCQLFTTEILKTMRLNTKKNKKFIIQKKFTNDKDITSNFTKYKLHVIHSVNNVLNIFQRALQYFI